MADRKANAVILGINDSPVLFSRQGNGKDKQETAKKNHNIVPSDGVVVNCPCCV